MNARDSLVPATATQEDLNTALAASTKPKISPEDLDRAIKEEAYYVFPGSCLTVCVLTLFNGFTVTGESACADPGNFQEDIGKTIARRNARDKIWSLLGFTLKTKLDMINKAGTPGGRIANYLGLATYVGTKVVHAAPMSRQQYNDLRGWTLPEDENGEDEGYLVQYADGGARNHDDFDGYISWSPRDVFERSYGVGVVPAQETIPTNLQRFDKEFAELDSNVKELTTFLSNNPSFDSLDPVEKNDLMSQHHHMMEYRWFLNRRLTRAYAADGK